MLVVTRREGESILIELPSGEQIEVVVLSVKGTNWYIG
jgi:sRNA-binding carbon storage regulator CsrA